MNMVQRLRQIAPPRVKGTVIDLVSLEENDNCPVASGSIQIEMRPLVDLHCTASSKHCAPFTR